jgi:hypothetical protein
MWFVPTKKELKHELDNIRASFRKVQANFKERDAKIEQLRAKIEENALKIITLEGSYLALSQKSQSQVSGKSHSRLETNLIQRIQHNKKALVMAEITKLLSSCSVIEAFDIVVRAKNLCSKASFYRYIASLKSQGLLTETEAETEPEEEVKVK